jgi:roadblock/LC7 domain-containing protein
MASTLKDLLGLKGVVAAGEFSRDGSLVDFEASVDFPEDLARRRHNSPQW